MPKKSNTIYSFFIGISILGIVNFYAPTASAHVIVNPTDVGIASYQTFVVGVPSEKDNPTIGLRLVIPDGVESVMPNVKSGWKIDVKKTGESETAKTTEVSWFGGVIPSGQRDEFAFSAKVPSSETKLTWKVYQTYQDGEVISWDQDPNTPKTSVKPGEDDEGFTPYSVTSVVNDLKPETSNNQESDEDNTENPAMLLAILALVLSGIALTISLRKKV